MELHEKHTGQEKVECFACHGKVSHGRKEVLSVSGMIDCQNCHSDTHQVQRTIYAADYHAEQTEAVRSLSPMFLTHVECSGCHIERVSKKTGTLDSFGKVAKAVPRACDNCHEEGAGQRYIPFWQGKIKTLYEEVSRKLDEFKEGAKLETNEQRAQQLQERGQQAGVILETVTSDGSWGVHNFKYTEAMLLKAKKKLISEEQ